FAPRSRIPHLRHLDPGRRQGRRRAHDRPPRNLYERRGLSRRSREKSQNALIGRPRAADALLAVSAYIGRRPKKKSSKSEEQAMTPTAAARAQTSAPSLRDRLKDASLLKDRCYIDGAWVGTPSRPVTNPVNGVELAKVPVMSTAETTQAVE